MLTIEENKIKLDKSKKKGLIEFYGLRIINNTELTAVFEIEDQNWYIKDSIKKFTKDGEFIL